jgi:hypothetical protein
MRSVCVGDHKPTMGSDQLVELYESNDISDDEVALCERLDKDGYLFIREFHDSNLVDAARIDVPGHMAEDGLLDFDEPVEDGIVHPDYFDEKFDVSAASWMHYSNLEELVEGKEITSFFKRHLNKKPWPSIANSVGRKRLRPVEGRVAALREQSTKRDVRDSDLPSRFIDRR